MSPKTLKKTQLAGDLMTAISSLPNDHYVTFNKEKNSDDEDDDDGHFLSACVFKAAPEDGWESRGARFQHAVGSESYQQPCEEHSKHEDCVIFGVTTDIDSPEILERLLINGIKGAIAKGRIK